jgi:hypothetical protein
MAREDFVINLRTAAQSLRMNGFTNGVTSGSAHDAVNESESEFLRLAPWLTPSLVDGFDPAEFPELSESDLKTLAGEVAAFLEIAKQANDFRETRNQLRKARGHLENVIAIVRKPVLEDWLNAQRSMLAEAKEVASLNGWSAQEDEKEVTESLLGTYQAPRLRIRSSDLDVIFAPIARFGSDGRGVVDLVTMPTYETSHYITLKDNKWWIAAANEPVLRHKRFAQRSLINALTGVVHR